MLLTRAAPGRHSISQDRATAPSPTLTAASRSPAKERPSQPKSASDDFSKLPSRRRQVITTFPFGSAVERSVLDRASVQIPPSLLFFFFCSFIFQLYMSSNPPVYLLVFFVFFCCPAVRTSTTAIVVLLYTHGGLVGYCWKSFSFVYCCAFLLYQVQRTAVLL